MKERNSGNSVFITNGGKIQILKKYTGMTKLENPRLEKIYGLSSK